MTFSIDFQWYVCLVYGIELVELAMEVGIVLCRKINNVNGGV